ncbi:hypothetical protein FRB94_011104 [Tulasnella sp. JGI-2019a]|nr:hypothetical protein FRB94_011104 [Tulasnella sp. JGI-2019a]
MEMLYMLTHHSRLMWYVMDSSVVKNVFALQSGTRDTHPLASEAEEVDDIIEDSGIFARDSHTGKVQKWLKGLCHWHRAFVDLGNKGAIVKLLAPRKLQIKVVEAMPIAEPTKQAPLSQTLMALRPLNQEFEKAARDSLRYQMQYAKGVEVWVWYWRVMVAAIRNGPSYLKGVLIVKRTLHATSRLK